MSNKVKTIGADSIQFYDTRAKVSLNHIPFGAQTIVPREGDRVFLPAEMTGGETGYYLVKEVEYFYQPDSATELPQEIGPIRLERVIVHVSKAR